MDPDGSDGDSPLPEGATGTPVARREVQYEEGQPLGLWNSAAELQKFKKGIEAHQARLELQHKNIQVMIETNRQRLENINQAATRLSENIEPIGAARVRLEQLELHVARSLRDQIRSFA